MWKQKIINNVLKQLNDSSYPFANYKFVMDENDNPVILGRGASAIVCEAYSTIFPKKRYALKIIGFSDNAATFKDISKMCSRQMYLCQMGENIVPIKEYKTLTLCFKGIEVIKILSSEFSNPPKETETKIQLKFILMDKMQPVIKYDFNRNPYFVDKEANLNNIDEFYKFAEDIGSALSSSHRDNIIHSDIKLENIFYDPKAKVYKLGDFGISEFSKYGVAQRLGGTPGYFAPEVYEKQMKNSNGEICIEYDSTVDIYSYGITLYLLLSGFVFPGAEGYTPNFMYQYIDGSDIQNKNNIPDKLFEMIKKLCKFNPDDRYQSIDEFLKDLNDYKNDAYVSRIINHEKYEKFLGAFIAGLSIAVILLNFDINILADMTKYKWVLIIAAFITNIPSLKENSKMHIIRRWELGLSLPLLFIDGISWKTFLFIFFISDSFLGWGFMFENMMISSFLLEFLMSYNMLDKTVFAEYTWVFAAVLIFGFMLVYQSFFHNMLKNKHDIHKNLFKNNTIWIIYNLVVVSMFITSLRRKGRYLWSGYLMDMIGFNISYDIISKTFGILLVLSFLWLIRNAVLTERLKESV